MPVVEVAKRDPAAASIRKMGGAVFWKSLCIVR